MTRSSETSAFRPIFNFWERRCNGLNDDFGHANQRVRLRVCQSFPALRVDFMDKRAKLVHRGIASSTRPAGEGRFEFHRQRVRLIPFGGLPICGDLRNQLVEG